MADVLALVVAGAFALMGAGALARPAHVLAQFGVEVETAAGRLVGAATERPAGIHPVWVYFAVEVLGAAGLLWAAWG